MRTPLNIVLILIAVMATAGTCSDSGGSGGDPDGGGGDRDTGSTDGDVDTDTNQEGDGLGAGCDVTERVGTFSILLNDDYTSVSGSIMDGVTPSSVPEVLATSGTCTLFGPRNLFCNPACTTLGETCGEEGVCITAPSKQDAGTITVDGMNAAVSIDPNAITSDYNMIVADPYPGFDVGASLTLTSTGGVFDPITLRGTGPAMVTGAGDTVEVARETPVSLNWTAGDVENTQMHILLDVNVHGARTGWIVCDAEDTGSFEIPAELVTTLIDLGLSGFPKVELSRRSIDTATVSSGCVELIVHTQATLSVEIPGLVSCQDDTDCEDGEVCEEDLVCR